MNAEYFPHIVDAIFDNSPLASLLVLRQVNKKFREMADRRIGFHLVLRGDQLPIEIHSGLLGERITTITASNYGSAILNPFPWTASARVVDIDAQHEYKELALLLLSWDLRWVYNLRFSSGKPQFGRKYLTLPAAERMVFFSADLPLHVEIVSDWNLSAFYQTTAVINMAVPSRSRWHANMDPWRSPIFWAPYIVVILHEWTEPMTPAEEVGGSLRSAFEGNLGDAFDLLIKSAIGNIRFLIIVGLEQLTPASVGLTEHDLGGQSVQEALLALLKAEWQKELDLARQNADDPASWQWESDFAKEMRHSFRFVTVEEYKDVIGEAEWNIETSSEVQYCRPRPRWPGERKLHERFDPRRDPLDRPYGGGGKIVAGEAPGHQIPDGDESSEDETSEDEASGNESSGDESSVDESSGDDTSEDEASGDEFAGDELSGTATAELDQVLEG